MLPLLAHLCAHSGFSLAMPDRIGALHPSVLLLAWTASNAQMAFRKVAIADLIILHEYGEPSHYQGAVSAATALEYKTVQQIEFTPLRKLKQGFQQRDLYKMKKELRDALLLAFWTLFPRALAGKTVILGIAPIDWRIIFLVHALAHARVIYHSSWTDWGGERYAKNPPAARKTVRKVWSYFLTRRVECFALVTPRVAEELERQFGISRERTYVVFQSYNQHIFQPARECDASPLKVIFAGRLDASKGVADVVELARRLPSVEFALVGNGPLKKSIETCGLPNVRLLGVVEDRAILSSIFSEHHVVVLPSKRTTVWEELFGMVLVEAMACGCIPMATDHPGPRTIIRDADLREFVFAEEEFLDHAESALRKLDTRRLRILKQKAIEESRRFAVSEIEKIWVKILQ